MPATTGPFTDSPDQAATPLPGGERRLPPMPLSLTAQVANLGGRPGAKSLAQSYGLDIQRVSWEDTARFKGSCWGPNISDMTLRCAGANMPVIRRPNMADLTCDIPSANFSVLVGNERGAPLTRVPLQQYVRDLARYADNANIGALWCERDATLLVSSQACILPVEAPGAPTGLGRASGKVNFHVKLYNYQSTYSQPAVLVIMANNQGTSCQVVTDDTDLYLNINRQAHDLTAQRLADDRAARGVAQGGAMTEEERARNVIFIYQIPLKVQRLARGGYLCALPNAMEEGCALSTYGSACLGSSGNRETSRGFDHAMLAQGAAKGEFKGTRGLTLERDPNFPIRLTVQYYYVTDTPDIPEPLMRSIAAQLETAYTHGTGKGSLVLSTTDRPTEAANLGTGAQGTPLSCCV